MKKLQIPGAILWISWRKYHIKMIKKGKDGESNE